MAKPFVAAAIQMCAGLDKPKNLRLASELVRQAAAAGAEFICLPELFNAYGSLGEVIARAEPVPGPTSTYLSDLARRLRVTLLGGSICRQSDPPGRCYNTSLLFGPSGNLLANYSKIHLFDVDVPATGDAPAIRVEESRYIEGGTEIVVAATTVARVGMSVCYDVRFPELYRRLVEDGAEMIAIPSAFAYTTGRDHWQTLVRARAIENQVFVVAANQCDSPEAQPRSYGYSSIVDPWGNVLAQADGKSTCAITATVDLLRIDEVRTRLPAISARRIFARRGDD